MATTNKGQTAVMVSGVQGLHKTVTQLLYHLNMNQLNNQLNRRLNQRLLHLYHRHTLIPIIRFKVGKTCSLSDTNIILFKYLE